jgi:hypothetical protein
LIKELSGTAACILAVITLTACSGMPTSPTGFSRASSAPGVQFDSNDGTAGGWSSSERSAATFLQNTEFALLTFDTRAETLADRREVRLLASELRRHYEAALDELQQVSILGALLLLVGLTASDLLEDREVLAYTTDRPGLNRFGRALRGLLLTHAAA